MELFEIDGLKIDKRNRTIEVYGYVFREGYHGKIQPIQKRLVFYYNTEKAQQFTMNFIKEQRRADGAKSVIEAFWLMIGTQIQVSKNMIRSVE